MNVNPYESPGEPETRLDERLSADRPFDQRPGLRLLRTCSGIVGIGAGALLGMAFMVVYSAKNLDAAYSVRVSLLSIVLIGGTSGAAVALVGILLLRAWSNVIRQRVNNRSPQNDGKNIAE